MRTNVTFDRATIERFEANDWPSQHYDMYVAAKIIDKYQQKDALMPLSVAILDEIEAKQLTWRDLPTWLQELTLVYISEYGLDYGQIIIAKVLTRCLLSGQTIH